MIEIIAHRGESAEAPENTIEAFLLAWTNGAAQGIEGDFHLTKDGVLVCMHDDDTLRTGGVDKKIADMTADEFIRLDVGRWKGKLWNGVHPPLLVDVLRSLPSDGKIFVEIKTDTQGLVKALEADCMAAQVRDNQIVVISFYANALRAIRKHLPNLKTLLLISPEFDRNTDAVKPSALELVKILRELDVDGVDCCAADHIGADYVQTVKQAGLEFHVWTVDDLETGLRFACYGVDSLTTNRPAALRREWPKGK